MPSAGGTEMEKTQSLEFNLHLPCTKVCKEDMCTKIFIPALFVIVKS